MSEIFECLQKCEEEFGGRNVPSNASRAGQLRYKTSLSPLGIAWS